jgi:pyruvate/2-oxoglutarate dehydrogenase complex dihydrolipoamide dehydrogenase (E3) component
MMTRSRWYRRNTSIEGEVKRSLEVEAILLAVGRQPNVEGLNLQAAGVVCNEQGIVVDAFLRTSVPSIFEVAPLW